jgi:hypothetical protein
MAKLQGGLVKFSLIIIRAKFNLPPEVLEVFQFELQSFKIGSLPPKVSKSGNLNIMLKFYIKIDGN